MELRIGYLVCTRGHQASRITSYHTPHITSPSQKQQKKLFEMLLVLSHSTLYLHLLLTPLLASSCFIMPHLKLVKKRKCAGLYTKSPLCPNSIFYSFHFYNAPPPAASAFGGPYSTWALGSPGAMKLVCGFFCAFAAEQRAMVGELQMLLVGLSFRRKNLA